MATISNSSSLERQTMALGNIVPEIRTLDQTWRRKYLNDFTQAFRTYESILDPSELNSLIAASSLILVGDYHSLPACQNFVAGLIKGCAQRNQPVVLAVETIFSRDQHILDEWWREEIGEAELRQRIRFDLDWGYDWDPFYQLLLSAREHCEAVFGLDCIPREDLRRIGIRDRHAAHKLAEVRQKHPNTAIVAFIGESHLAPAHLPALVEKEIPNEKLFTILQNVDALYWAASRKNDVRAIRVDDRTACIFNATPLEKYESYRACLDRWRHTKDESIDFAPAVYELIDRLLRYLDINRYSPSNGKQPKFVVDLLPEVIDYSSAQFPKLLMRVPECDKAGLLEQLQERGCLYVPQCNGFVIQQFHSGHVAAEAARFVYRACQGLASYSSAMQSQPHEHRLHSEKLERALASLGSRILCGAGIDSKTPKNINNDSFATGLHRSHLQGTLSRNDLKRIFLFPVSASGKAAELCSHLTNRLKLTS